MEAVEGVGNVPAYRGTAYVVLEDVSLERFGNRVPQFSFEVVKGSPAEVTDASSDMSESVRAVALMPGTGEYALATSPVRLKTGPATFESANEHSPSGQTDFVTSVDSLIEELPNAESTSLIVSWFGNDLRANHCELHPKVEQIQFDGDTMPWTVSGISRTSVSETPQIDARPVYGGTPCDLSVCQAISHLNSNGTKVVFYPFILMDQLSENGLPDPWSDAEHQPVLPWRGRITLSVAQGQEGSSSGSAAADAEVATFFGSASASDFTIGTNSVSYSGPDEWSYRRFILHYAALCASAGGVDAFCIGSEMRGLTQVMGSAGFPAVDALVALAAEVRQLLGPEVKIGYAADWSEYFGYHPQDGSGDVYFHLDSLWSDDNIDFVGIDNYMPLSDWRDGDEHLDAERWSSIYDTAYLASNIEGGEGYDWYYHSEEARQAQIRSEISDGTHNEPWVFRYKDIRNWWSNPHFERVAGVRSEISTSWSPQSKPVWFTEIGCAAIDKGTNQPNKFLDPKSSESQIPHYSNGARDDLIQQKYLQTMANYWSSDANNPSSTEYVGKMVDVSRMHVWAWDARPFPAFPNNQTVWSDGLNYQKGHWINGRNGNRTLANVVAEICTNAGLENFDVSSLHGTVRGYVQDDVSDARSALQPLMVAYGFDAVERDGLLIFKTRGTARPEFLDPDEFAIVPDADGIVERERESEAEVAGKIRLSFIQAGSDFQTASEEAIHSAEPTSSVGVSETPLALLRGEGRLITEKWLAESRVARDKVKFALPPSRLSLGAGDVVGLSSQQGGFQNYRIDRVEQGSLQQVDGIAIESSIYRSIANPEELPRSSLYEPPIPVTPLFLDIPLITGDEVPHAPHLAVTGKPWPGSVAVYDAPTDEGYILNSTINVRAVVGVTESPMFAASPGLYDNGDALQVRLISGELESISDAQLLNGGNLMAIGDGSSDHWELFQFGHAELFGDRQYWLSRRLRGQLGSDAVTPSVWPVGSWVVLLDGNVRQIDLSAASRNLARHYRIGSARRSLQDSTFTHRVEAFSGIGLRPLSPVHLNVKETAQGDIGFSWIRRTRIDGDDWDIPEVPLGEESENYHIRISQNGEVRREETTLVPIWTYSHVDQVADGVLDGFQMEVAQISARYGVGAFRSVQVA
ncbi:glycoside hydrolase/phage tail family protein [Shimia sp.]|uniref:baseplate multidomain protein megatron n=1 Tax=Shimia sp. TaxID=1954381 RepID=UPI003298B47E